MSTTSETTTTVERPRPRLKVKRIDIEAAIILQRMSSSDRPSAVDKAINPADESEAAVALLLLARKPIVKNQTSQVERQNDGVV